MTLRLVEALWPPARRRKREEANRRAVSFLGKATSAYLTPGERQRLFRARRKP